MNSLNRSVWRFRYWCRRTKIRLFRNIFIPVLQGSRYDSAKSNYLVSWWGSQSLIRLAEWFLKYLFRPGEGPEAWLQRIVWVAGIRGWQEEGIYGTPRTGISRVGASVCVPLLEVLEQVFNYIWWFWNMHMVVNHLCFNAPFFKCSIILPLIVFCVWPMQYALRSLQSSTWQFIFYTTWGIWRTEFLFKISHPGP